MKRYLILVFLLSSGFAEPAPAQTLNCKTKVIQVGDPADQVHVYCGEPASVEKETKLFENGGKLAQRCFHGSVNIEKWIYKRAFGRLNTVVTVVEGQVEHISSGAGGFERGWRSPCS